MSDPISALGPSIEHRLAAANVPGCTCAIVDTEGHFWSGGWGWADLANARKAEADNVFHLFSGTKLFTATAILQLAEQGLLSLDEPAAAYLPDAGLPTNISLVHLLSHRSGLRDTLRAFLDVTFPKDPAPTAAEALAAYAIRARRRPGERVEYRNVNYALLGEIVTRVSGIEYRDYIVRRVLAPLGMEAGFTISESARPRAAVGYVGRWDPMRLLLAMISAARGPRGPWRAVRRTHRA